MFQEAASPIDRALATTIIYLAHLLIFSPTFINSICLFLDATIPPRSRLQWRISIRHRT